MPLSALTRTTLTAALLLNLPSQAATTTVSDICVYGGAAGGVTAAVQARRMGKSVTLLAYNNHLGGLSSGGLGETDIGNHGNTYIQGIAREFYTRVGKKYNEGAKFRFEPKVAEAVFFEMASEAGVTVRLHQRIASTTMENGSIRQITMDDGSSYRARIFIDASYEGDLMKQAGVSFTAGREANSQYGETINGIQTKTSGNQLPDGIDPYVIKGIPASGLLPGVNPSPGGPDGSADPLIQAYCYRMCLTNVPANRIPVPQPENYNEQDYEILFRAIEAGQTNRFWKLSPMPNGKTDSNNDSGASCDYISGKTGNYIEADHATRAKIAREHEFWQRGLVWTIQNHPRVPKAIRDAWGQWGLPKDEFTDTHHWPHQLYVREARRMISDYVMTEKNCMGTTVPSDPVTLAAYTMDSHNCQRIVHNGMVKNEGDIQRAVPGPYPISYRSIVPKATECPNLLVPWSLSATHIAFGSIRMEPVFMNLGQVAATAACFAIDDQSPVQAVPYPKLKAQLLADQQRLTMADDSSAGITVDNSDPSAFSSTGTWTASSAIAGFIGTNYLHDSDARNGTCSARFTPNIPATGTYQVHLRWTANDNRASNVPVTVRHANGTTTISPAINQRTNGSQWVLVGSFQFNTGSSPTAGSVTLTNQNTNGYVIADAVRFTSTSEKPTVSLWATDAQAAESPSAFTQTASFTVSRSGPTDAPLTIHLQTTGTATPGQDIAQPPTTLTFASGESSKTIRLTATPDNLAEGPESLTLQLSPNPAYLISSLDQARITISDDAFDDWKTSHFSPSELTNPSLSGSLADADHDGIPNLLEFFAGRDPRHCDAQPVLSLTLSDAVTLATHRHPNAAYLALELESSPDLASWQSEQGNYNAHSVIDDGPLQQLVFTLSPTPDTRFYRLAVSHATNPQLELIDTNPLSH